MASRREARQWAMQILFELDMNPQPLPDVFRDFWARRRVERASAEFAEGLVIGVWERLKEIDELIQKHAENWDIRRMGRVDKSVMRMAVHEMLHRTDIPPVVSINEAVDIAKEFGGSSSGGFVNGILDRIRMGLDRPARQCTPQSQP